jgi:hypothetical protein
MQSGRFVAANTFSLFDAVHFNQSRGNDTITDIGLSKTEKDFNELNQ